MSSPRCSLKLSTIFHNIRRTPLLRPSSCWNHILSFSKESRGLIQILLNFTADCSPVDDVDDDVCGGEDNPGHAVYSAHGVQSFLGVADGSGHAPGQWTRDTYVTPDTVPTFYKCTPRDSFPCTDNKIRIKILRKCKLDIHIHPFSICFQCTLSCL